MKQKTKAHKRIRMRHAYGNGVEVCLYHFHMALIMETIALVFTACICVK